MKTSWSFRRRWAGISAAAILWATGLLAADPPEWLRAAARGEVPQYPREVDAVVLLDEQVTTVKDNGEVKTVYRRAVKILRPEGRDQRSRP